MDNEKKISVITPYYKGQATVFDTIDSVLESIKKCANFKLQYILIIDSMEDKIEIIEKIKKKYGDIIDIIENEKNIGVAASRNKAIKFATFDYVLFLDQDDILDQDYFKVSSKAVEKNSDLIVCNAYVVNVKNNKKVKMYNKKPNLNFKGFLKGNKILSPGQVLYSKRITEVEDLYTGCSSEFKGADDWASYLNIFINFENVKTNYVEEPVFYYNLHDNNYSKNWKELNMSAVKTAEYFLEKVSATERKILEKQIDFLLFENEFKDSNYKFTYRDIKKICKYYSYSIFDYNKIIHYINKRIINFNK
ncbi:MAG: glycosyltransferase family 2 protein [Sarcina sp.]